MSRPDKIYILDIIESVKIILSYIEDKTEFEFIKELIIP